MTTMASNEPERAEGERVFALALAGQPLGHVYVAGLTAALQVSVEKLKGAEQIARRREQLVGRLRKESARVDENVRVETQAVRSPCPTESQTLLTFTRFWMRKCYRLTLNREWRKYR